MSETTQPPAPEVDAAGSADPEPQDVEQEAAAPEDVAAANRRRMREALEHKRGVHHPDDRAGTGGGVRGSAPPSAGRDFTRRRSG